MAWLSGRPFIVLQGPSPCLPTPGFAAPYPLRASGWDPYGRAWLWRSNYECLREILLLCTNSDLLSFFPEVGPDDFDSLSVTDSGVFSDDACSSGRASPVSSCKEGAGGHNVVDRDRFAILTYDQVTKVDSVLNEMVALEGRGNFPALELKLIDLLTAVKDRLVQEGIKVRFGFYYSLLFLHE